MLPPNLALAITHALTPPSPRDCVAADGGVGVNRAKSLSLDEFVVCIVNIACMHFLIERQEASGVADAIDRLLGTTMRPRVCVECG